MEDIDDKVVKLRLRQAKQPIHLFGETPGERLDRLTDFLEKYALQHGEHFQFKQYPLSGNWGKKITRVLTQDQTYLVMCRQKILKSSLILAASRHKSDSARLQQYDAIQLQEQFEETVAGKSKYEMTATQFGDIGNVMRGSFSPDGWLYATAGGSSEARLWSIPSAQEKSKLFGHTGKLHDIVFHPLAGALPRGAPNIATASTDSDVRLWTLDPNMEFQKSLPLKGHSDRVNRVVYHNTGDFLFSVSFDETWIFWDLTKAKRLYRQTGHNRPIYSLSMHPDGSLILTGDTKGRAMVWDLRTGKSILPLIGHKAGILASDFSQNGFLVATGGQDNTIRVWDIRRKNCMAVVPAHTKIVSDLKFNEGSSILTSVSHDNTMKLWHGHHFTLLNNYRAHDSKISSIAISKNHIATTTLDRKWSLWQQIHIRRAMEIEEPQEEL